MKQEKDKIGKGLVEDAAVYRNGKLGEGRAWGRSC